MGRIGETERKNEREAEEKAPYAGPNRVRFKGYFSAPVKDAPPLQSNGKKIQRLGPGCTKKLPAAGSGPSYHLDSVNV